MDFLGLALAVLKLANFIMGFVDRQQLMEAGRQEEIAKVSAEIMRKTAAGKAIMEKVNQMSDVEVDIALHELEPRTPK
jgi:hypothetical protein